LSQSSDARIAAGARLGYVAHERDASSCRGALVVLTLDGDPLDLVYTDPVPLGRLVETLLGPRLDAYLLARVLVAPLLAQARERPTLLCFEEPRLLLRRLSLDLPAVVLAEPDLPHRPDCWRPRQLGAEREAVWLGADSNGFPLGVLEEARRGMAPAGLREPFRQLRAAMAALPREASR